MDREPDKDLLWLPVGGGHPRVVGHGHITCGQSVKKVEGSNSGAQTVGSQLSPRWNYPIVTIVDTGWLASQRPLILTEIL